jgi:hypothetical protein
MNKWAEKLKPFIVLKVVYPLIRLLWRSCRIEVEALPLFLQTAEKEKCLVALWHSQLLAAPYLIEQLAPHLDFAALISNSRDGDWLALLQQHLPNAFPIRVAHDKKSSALRACVDALKEGKVLLITPDGPRGPRGQIKPGILFVSELAKAPTFALRWRASRCWRLPTWDQLALPQPFTKIVLTFEGPLRDLSREQASQERLSAALGPF